MLKWFLRANREVVENANFRPLDLCDIECPFLYGEPFFRTARKIQNANVGTSREYAIGIMPRQAGSRRTAPSFSQNVENTTLPDPNKHHQHANIFNPVKTITMDHQTYCLIESLQVNAIALIAAGSYSEASKGLSGALRQLLPHVLDPRSVDDENDRYHRDEDIENLVMQCVPLCPPTAPSKVEERIFPLFSHALFYTRCDASRPWRLEDYRRSAAATVYNMALANHFQALHEPAGSVRRDCLDRALKSYTAARDVLEAVADNDDLADATEDVKFLLLAIANNEGHVCEQLSFLDRARDCLGQLHVILPCTSRSEEFGQFLVTAILFPKPERLSLHAPVA